MIGGRTILSEKPMPSIEAPVILVSGIPVPTLPFEHTHGRPEDLFLEVLPAKPVPPGTQIAWSGEMPEGKKTLWVRIPCSLPWRGVVEGNFLLREEDHR